MKKKILAIFAATAVLTMSVIPAFAAESPVTGQAAEGQVAEVSVIHGTAAELASGVTVSDGFSVAAVSNEDLASLNSTAAGNLLYAASSIGEYFTGKSANQEQVEAVKAAATDPNKKIVAELIAAVEVDPTTATQNADGKYVFTLAVSGVAADTLGEVYHIKADGSTDYPEFVFGAGSVTVTTAECSPFAVVTYKVVNKAAATTTTTTTTTTPATTTAAPVSPKTGEAVPYVLFVAAVALGAAFVCGKKYFAR